MNRTSDRWRPCTWLPLMKVWVVSPRQFSFEGRSEDGYSWRYAKKELGSDKMSNNFFDLWRDIKWVYLRNGN
jgi:hypothetical protein